MTLSEPFSIRDAISEYLGFNQPLLDVRALARCPSCCPPVPAEGGDLGVDPVAGPYILSMARTISTGLEVYQLSTVGFGSLKSTLALGYDELTSDNTQIVKRFSPTGGAVGVLNVDAYPLMYRWSAATGFGAAYSAPASPPTVDTWSIKNFVFSPDGQYIVTAHQKTLGQVIGYAWNDATGFGAALATPSIVLGNPLGLAFSPSGGAVAISLGDAPFIEVRRWSAAGFGAAYTPPSPAAAAGIGGVSFSPAGDAIIVTGQASPFVSAYAWSDAGGFGAALPAPSPAIPGTCDVVAFSPDGTAVALISAGSPYLVVYAWSAAGFGAKFANPATLITAPYGVMGSLKFSALGDLLVASSTALPVTHAYQWSAAGFGAKLAAPAPARSAYSGQFDLSP